MGLGLAKPRPQLAEWIKLSLFTLRRWETRGVVRCVRRFGSRRRLWTEEHMRRMKDFYFVKVFATRRDFIM